MMDRGSFKEVASALNAHKVRLYECTRYGHLWVGMGYGRFIIDQRCRRCGEHRTVTR